MKIKTCRSYRAELLSEDGSEVAYVVTNDNARAAGPLAIYYFNRESGRVRWARLTDGRKRAIRGTWGEQEGFWRVAHTMYKQAQKGRI